MKTKWMKAISIILCILVVCFLHVVEAKALITDGTCGDNLRWRLNNDTGALTITGSGAMYDYDTSNKAPWGSSVKSVTIQSGVTTIGAYAFYGCKGVSSISLPDTVTDICDSAFRSSGLVSITIPDSVKKISDLAFYQCSLYGIHIPASVETIEGRPFIFCSNLTNIHVDSQNAAYASIDGVLFNKNCTQLIQYPIGNQRTSYIIPDNVTSVLEQAFRQAKNLTEILIPEGIERIEKSAFEDCRKLESVIFPTTLTHLGQSSFFRCDSLTEITFLGAPPKFGIETGYTPCPFTYVEATVYYPNLSEWDSNVRQDYGGTLTWVEYTHNHVDKTIPAIAPTCTETGKTKGTYCLLCGEELIAPETVPALGHQETIIPATPPSLESTGMTSGVYCSICNTILVAQEVVPKATTVCSVVISEVFENKYSAEIRNNKSTLLDAILIIANFSRQGQLSMLELIPLEINALGTADYSFIISDESNAYVFVVDKNGLSPLNEKTPIAQLNE